MTQLRTGRPPATTHGQLEQISLRLFASRGFDATTVDDIAAEAGIARRTFFTYFGSKNDVVWGDFDSGLTVMRERLAQTDPAVGVIPALKEAVLELNAFPPEITDLHRERMQLVLHVPALMAHSTLRYAAWRQVVTEFAVTRLSVADALLLGHLSLGAAVAAYEQWLGDPEAALPDLLSAAFDRLEAGFAP